MPKGKAVNTTPNSKGSGWVNHVGGKPTGTVHRTQETAAEKGKAIAKHNESEHMIHGRDGKIRSKDSYGTDPNPPRDREH